MDQIAEARNTGSAYATELISGEHKLIADEPLANGGKDMGPSPGDYLRMALAACTTITLRMYINRKKMDVGEIYVTVTSEKSESGTRFVRSISIDGTVTPEQEARLLHVANACPVHQTLTHTITVDTKLSKA